jgi:hypothetical protein
MSLAEMTRLVAADTDRWSGVIKAGGIKTD